MSDLLPDESSTLGHSLSPHPPGGHSWHSQCPDAPSLCPGSGTCPSLLGADWLLGQPQRREGIRRLCFPSSRCYLQLVLKADFGVLVPAPAAEQPVSIGVRGARGPVVAFLPLGGRGCNEQKHNRSCDDLSEGPTVWPRTTVLCLRTHTCMAQGRGQKQEWGRGHQ